MHCVRKAEFLLLDPKCLVGVVKPRQNTRKPHLAPQGPFGTAEGCEAMTTTPRTSLEVTTGRHRICATCAKPCFWSLATNASLVRYAYLVILHETHAIRSWLPTCHLTRNHGAWRCHPQARLASTYEGHVVYFIALFALQCADGVLYHSSFFQSFPNPYVYGNVFSPFSQISRGKVNDLAVGICSIKILVDLSLVILGVVLFFVVNLLLVVLPFRTLMHLAGYLNRPQSTKTEL